MVLGEGGCGFGFIGMDGARGGEAGVWIIGDRELLRSGCEDFEWTCSLLL